MKIALIFNPNAGNNRGSVLVPYLREKFDDLEIEYLEVSEPTLTGALDILQSLVSSVDAIVAVGGDGTIHRAAQLAWKHALPLGIVAAGSGDDIARGCGLPFGRTEQDLRRAADYVVAAIANGDIAAVDAAIVTTSQGEARLVLAVVGFGFDSRVSVIADKILFPRGTARYIWSFIRALGRFAPISYSITVDGQSRQTTGMLADVCNSPTYGGGMKISPSASMFDGKLDLVFLRQVSLPALLGLFAKIFDGKHVNHPAFDVIQGSTFVLEAEGEQAWGDGEFISHSPVTVRVSPSVLQVYGARNQ